MTNTIKEVLEFVNENDVKFIRLAFCDLCGVEKNLSIMPGELISAFENGNSTNINHLFIYLHSCKSKEEQEMFLNMLNEKIKERLETEYILFNHQAIGRG